MCLIKMLQILRKQNCFLFRPGLYRLAVLGRTIPIIPQHHVDQPGQPCVVIQFIRIRKLRAWFSKSHLKGRWWR